jgi:hypothetical protein
MNINHSAIGITILERERILKMTWAREVDVFDVVIAFQQVTRHLDCAQEPLALMLDLRQDPQFPIQATITEALNGPFAHPMAREWLIVGRNALAEMAVNLLRSIERRGKIHWFDDEASAISWTNQFIQ